VPVPRPRNCYRHRRRPRRGAPAAPPPLRTRYFTSLTNLEVETYLQYNDVIVVPIGNIQAHGTLPVDCEYVTAEAIALRMAEGANGRRFLDVRG
jgi:hypothetical protein